MRDWQNAKLRSSGSWMRRLNIALSPLSYVWIQIIKQPEMSQLDEVIEGRA